MEKIKPFLYLGLAAICYCLGFPNIFSIYIPFLPIIGFAILVHQLILAGSTKKRLLLYFFYNTIINVLSFYWITATLQEFGKLPFIVAAIMNGAFAFVFNPQYVVLIFTIHLIENYLPKLKEHLFSTGMSSFIFAAFLTTLEYTIPQQFPVMLGQPWIVLSEFLGAAKYLGLPVFSFMSYLLAFEILNGFRKKTLSYTNLLSIMAFIFINPFLVSKVEKTEMIDFNVRLVQANISNFLKVDSETGGYASVQEVLARYESLSSQGFTGNGDLDLIVWPETAYPYPINTNKDDLKLTLVPNIFSQIIEKTKASLFIGGYDHFRNNPDGSYYKSEYNAGLYFNQQAELEEVFHKHILIPFGETLPLGPLNETVSKYLPEMAFFAEGSKFPIFKTSKGINFISSICYEILRPEFFREYLNNQNERPHLMINLTNDSWYGNTVEPEQHLFLARWRAIEFDLPILRSTNTGISTFIRSDGTEMKRLEYDITGNLDLTLKLPKFKNPEESAQTFFQKYGFMGILPLWLLYLIFHFILIKLSHDK